MSRFVTPEGEPVVYAVISPEDDKAIAVFLEQGHAEWWSRHVGLLLFREQPCIEPVTCTLGEADDWVPAEE